MSENPYKSAETESVAGRHKPMFTIGRILLGVAVVGLLVMLLMPMQRGSREGARRNSCINNSKQIMLALLNYETEHGTFPPAYTVDDEGNRLHSWRTLILPYMEQKELFQQIDLTKSWDDPANAEARETVVHAYLCPSAPYEDEHLTTYLAVVGTDAFFTGSTPRVRGEYGRGSSQTIAVIDASAEHAVHWMSPQDISVEEVLEKLPEMRSHHMDLFIAGYVDGSIDTLQSDTDREVLRQLLTAEPTSPAPGASAEAPDATLR